MKPKHARLRFVLGSILVMGLAVALMLRSFNNSIIFFYTPTQLHRQQAEPGFDATRELRIGGLVEKGSVRNLPGNGIHFTITDLTEHLGVTYHGLMPSLFREGQGVVAQGTLEGDTLLATTILAKHDETYMPREVVDQLKASGRWQEGGVSIKGGLTPPARPVGATPAASRLAHSATQESSSTEDGLTPPARPTNRNAAP